MKHGSLFSGIGGFDLAAEWMGWQNIFHCEWMPFPQKVLKHYWPGAISYHDITTTDFRQHYGQLDILTGGFPCQPYSAAGKRLGKDDERHLWPHMLRAIQEISPRWVVGENVRGLTNWNGGVVFDEVQADLESAGYEVLPFLLPAVAVNAPHRRDRIWFVAYNENAILGSKIKCRRETYRQIRPGIPTRFGTDGKNEITPNTNLHGLQQRDSNNEEHTGQGWQYAQRDTQQGYGDGNIADADDGRTWRKKTGQQRQQYQSEGREIWSESFAGSSPSNWDNFPTQSPICGGDDGLPAQLDGITFPKWRAESIKGYGNAIVPQVALQIFRAIQQYEAVTMPHSSPRSQTHKE